jgi:hypothetical protein
MARPPPQPRPPRRQRPRPHRRRPPHRPRCARTVCAMVGRPMSIVEDRTVRAVSPGKPVLSTRIAARPAVSMGSAASAHRMRNAGATPMGRAPASEGPASTTLDVSSSIRATPAPPTRSASPSRARGSGALPTAARAALVRWTGGIGIPARPPTSLVAVGEPVSGRLGAVRRGVAVCSSAPAAAQATRSVRPPMEQGRSASARPGSVTVPTVPPQSEAGAAALCSASYRSRPVSAGSLPAAAIAPVTAGARREVAARRWRTGATRGRAGGDPAAPSRTRSAPTLPSAGARSRRRRVGSRRLDLPKSTACIAVRTDSLPCLCTPGSGIPRQTESTTSGHQCRLGHSHSRWGNW